MISFGRMQTGETWIGCDAELIDSALTALRESLASVAEDREFVLLKPGRLPQASAKERFLVSISPTSDADRTQVVTWYSARAGMLSGRWLTIRVLAVDGGTYAGLLLRLDRLYRIDDCCRALEAAFDTGRERDGRFAVLESVRVMTESIKISAERRHAGAMAAFHCENQSCSRHGRQLLLAIPPGKRHLFARHKVSRRAYPCPFCRGSLDKRWALTFDGLVGGPGGGEVRRERNAVFADLPVDVPYRRIGSRVGPMKRVTRDLIPKWGNCWDAASVRTLAPEMQDSLSAPRLMRLLDAVGKHEDSAMLASAALEGTNLRAFIEAVREIPATEKSPQLALAMAALFLPRRQSRIITVDDDTDEADARHPYIAYDPRVFFERLRFYNGLEARGKFLDVGAGIGEKPFLAYALGQFSECDGIEVNQQTLAVADFLLASIQTEYKYPISIFSADALAFNGYGDYQVIYMYRPIRDNRLYCEMMRWITAQMQPGSLIFDVYFPFMALRREEDGLYRVSPDSEEQPIWLGPIEVDEALEACGLRPDREAQQAEQAV